MSLIAPAADALERGDLSLAVEALLTAWRSLKHPRVADALDLVGGELKASQPPLEGKTLAAQLEAWTALAKKRRAADLERLLAQRLPGTWQKAEPMLRELLEPAWGEDPRLDRFIAQSLAAPPYSSYASWGYFRHLKDPLAKLTDVRVVPLLEEAQRQKHPSWYGREGEAAPPAGTHRALVQQAIERLSASPVAPLAEAEEDALDRIESRYREALASAHTKARSETSLLADIFAAPEDLHRRAVFADWLCEHGDPRGEFITLQLAAAPTREQQLRMNALQKKHGRAWAGPLDPWFDKAERLYEGGFLTGGRLVQNAQVPLEQSLDEPAWRLVHTIELDRWTSAPVTRLPALRTLLGLSEQPFFALGRGAPLPLTEVCFEARWSSTVGAVGAEALPGFRAVRTLGLSATEATLEWGKQSPLFKQLSRLRLRASDGLAAWLGFITEHLPNVRSVELSSELASSWLEPEGWRLELSRTGAGSFSEVRGRWGAGRHNRYALVTDLARYLALLSALDVRSIQLGAARTMALSIADRTCAEDSLSRFSNATIEVPWEREAEPGPKPAPAGPRIRLALKGDSLLGEKPLTSLWPLLPRLGLTFDSYSVGYGGHRPLGKKPLEVVLKWAKNPRCSSLHLYQDGAAEDGLRLTRSRWGDGGLRLEVSLGGHDVETWLATLMELLDAHPFSSGTCEVHSTKDDATRAPFLAGFSGPNPGWLMIFSEKQRPLLPLRAVQGLARAPGLAGCFVREGRKHLVLGLSAAPANPAATKLQALDAALREIVTGAFAKQAGVDVPARFSEVLGPLAKSRGFEPVKKHRGWGLEVRFERGEDSIDAQLYGLLGDPFVALSARRKINQSSAWSLDVLRAEPFVPATFERTLAQAAAKLAADLDPFLADPQKFLKRRR